MPNRVRVNIVNPAELLDLPGIGPREADAIVRFRVEHGPIRDEAELSRVLGWRALAPPLAECVDFAPAWDTAPEAPGA